MHVRRIGRQFGFNGTMSGSKLPEMMVEMIPHQLVPFVHGQVSEKGMRLL